jgi:group I intron endonuclease
MIGIYKITSPTGRIYIGQSINIEARFYVYKKKHCKKQPALFNSLSKHGVDNHFFEVIEECEISALNERERYYQDLFFVIEKGLNCKLTKTNDKSGYISQASIQKRTLTMMSKEKNKKYVSEFKLNLYTQAEYSRKVNLTKSRINQLVKNNKLDIVIITGGILIKI